MANDLNGFLAVYSQESLKQLVAKAPMLSAFSTDYSPEILEGGTSVVVPVSTTTWAAQDTAANGYVALNATSSAKTVTLAQRDVTLAFTELQWATMTPQRLLNTFIPGMVSGLVNTIVSDTLDLMVTGSTKITSAAAAFSASAAANVAQKLSTANCPVEDRSLIIAPTYFETLASSLSSAYIYGNAEIVQNYRMLNAYGFRVSEYTNIPAGGFNIYGVACHKSAFLVAMRAPYAVNNGNVVSQTVTDESSGISIQFRMWHDATNAKHYVSVVSIYGVALGNTAAYIPIVSA